MDMIKKDRNSELYTPVKDIDLKKPIANMEQATDTANYWNGGFIGTKDIFKAYIPYFLYKPPFGYPRTDIDIINVKKLGLTPYVWNVKKALMDRISSVDWDIKLKDKKAIMTPELQAKADKIKEWFSNPNGNFESWCDIQKALLMDIFDFDSGVLVKVFDKSQKFSQVFARAGETFLQNPNVYGYLGDRADFVDTSLMQSADASYVRQMYKDSYSETAAYFQYGWTPGSMPIPFGKREIIYLKMNSRSDSIYGRSPVQVLYETILILIYGGRYNLDAYINNNLPQGIMSVEGATQSQIDNIQSRLQDKVSMQDTFDNFVRKPYYFPMLNKKVEYNSWFVNPAELQILEQQKWYQQLVWQSFGVTPDEMGVTEDSNRAVANEQAKIVKKRAIKPILKQFEYAWNRELMPELDPEGLFVFEYDYYDVEEDFRKNELYEKKLSYMTKNEIRELEDLKPIDGGDQFESSMQNPFNQDSDFGTQDKNKEQDMNKDKNEPEDEPKDKLFKPTKAETKSNKKPENEYEKELINFYKDLEVAVEKVAKEQL